MNPATTGGFSFCAMSEKQSPRSTGHEPHSITSNSGRKARQSERSTVREIAKRFQRLVCDARVPHLSYARNAEYVEPQLNQRFARERPRLASTEQATHINILGFLRCFRSAARVIRRSDLRGKGQVHGWWPIGHTTAGKCPSTPMQRPRSRHQPH
jgi:hypothetical protein